MYTSRLMELLDTVRSKFLRTETAEKARSQEIEELGEEIMEYGRMMQHEYPHQKIFVNVTEVARRFREERRRVIKALVLLRTQGKAEHTDRNENWTLRI